MNPVAKGWRKLREWTGPLFWSGIGVVIAGAVAAALITDSPLEAILVAIIFVALELMFTVTHRTRDQVGGLERAVTNLSADFNREFRIRECLCDIPAGHDLL